MFEYDFGEVGVWPMRVNHKLSPYYGEGGGGVGGETCLPFYMSHTRDLIS